MEDPLQVLLLLEVSFTPVLVTNRRTYCLTSDTWRIPMTSVIVKSSSFRRTGPNLKSWHYCRNVLYQISPLFLRYSIPLVYQTGSSSTPSSSILEISSTTGTPTSPPVSNTLINCPTRLWYVLNRTVVPVRDSGNWINVEINQRILSHKNSEKTL